MIDEADSSRMYEQFGGDVIRTYWEGNSVRETAKLLGISEWSVRKILRIAGGEIPHPNTHAEYDAHNRIPDEKVREMKTLAEQGFNIKQIAEALNVRRGTVSKYVPEAAEDRTKSTLAPEVLDKMSEMAASKQHTITEIAEAVGVSWHTVRKYHPEAMLVKKNNSLPTEMLEHIRLLVEDGAPITEIEKTTGVYRATIKKYFPNAGLGHSAAAEYRWMMRRMSELEQTANV